MKMFGPINGKQNFKIKNMLEPDLLEIYFGTGFKKAAKLNFCSFFMLYNKKKSFLNKRKLVSIFINESLVYRIIF